VFKWTVLYSIGKSSDYAVPFYVQASNFCAGLQCQLDTKNATKLYCEWHHPLEAYIYGT
jgi:hypothetical protein